MFVNMYRSPFYWAFEHPHSLDIVTSCVTLFCYPLWIVELYMTYCEHLFWDPARHNIKISEESFTVHSPHKDAGRAIYMYVHILTRVHLFNSSACTHLEPPLRKQHPIENWVPTAETTRDGDLLWSPPPHPTGLGLHFLFPVSNLLFLLSS